MLCTTCLASAERGRRTSSGIFARWVNAAALEIKSRAERSGTFKFERVRACSLTAGPNICSSTEPDGGILSGCVAGNCCSPTNGYSSVYSCVFEQVGQGRLLRSMCAVSGRGVHTPAVDHIGPFLQRLFFASAHDTKRQCTDVRHCLPSAPTLTVGSRKQKQGYALSSAGDQPRQSSMIKSFTPALLAIHRGWSHSR